jgi:hypothetical protein
VKNIDHVRVHLAAREIAESAHVAYWLDGENNQVRDHHLRSVSEEFAKLAGLLGYRIEKIEEQPAEIVILHREPYVSEFPAEIA